MKYKIIIFMTFVFTLNINAQFNTIQNKDKKGYIILENKKNINETDVPLDTIIPELEKKKISKEEYRLARKRPPRTKGKRTFTYSYIPSDRLKGLTIKNLYYEILKNNIHHPKIVLAQAILETGWFKSSVCRNKGNLFGLTNPRTGQYYEFNHWKESVKAYRDKVQYKYKGGNYLLWLRNIGYAEDPRYVSSLIKILEQHFL